MTQIGFEDEVAFVGKVADKLRRIRSVLGADLVVWRQTQSGHIANLLPNTGTSVTAFVVWR